MDGMTMFRITYDGPALKHHEMDAREFAPALLAVADLLEASCKALYGESAKPQINVKGSSRTGSFNIDFVTAVSWLTSIRDMFAGSNAAAIADSAGRSDRRRLREQREARLRDPCRMEVLRGLVRRKHRFDA